MGRDYPGVHPLTMRAVHNISPTQFPQMWPESRTHVDGVEPLAVLDDSPKDVGLDEAPPISQTADDRDDPNPIAQSTPEAPRRKKTMRRKRSED